jgi:iron(III) transport system substrate-binding protein
MRFITLAAALLFSFSAAAQTPPGYPADYGKTVDAAKKEGKLIVYATTDAVAANPLVKDFEALYPGISVEYSDLNSTEVYNRFISESAAGSTADFIWSSAMDLQVKLVAEGKALTYASPEIPSLPKWAVWKNEAYGTTNEPIAFVYNKRIVPANEVPQTHADLAKLLAAKPDFYKGKVTAYDPERSGVGYLFVTEDVKNWPDAWSLFREFGKTGARLYTSAGAMMERVGSGEHLIAYGIFGSYAIARAKKDPGIGIVLPKDFTLITSRVAFISKQAQHPNAAKLFLDYVLSKRGQTIIANQALLYSLRDDVEGPASAKAVREEVGDKARPVEIGPGLLANLDQMNRLEFLKKWQAAMKGQ